MEQYYVNTAKVSDEPRGGADAVSVYSHHSGRSRGGSFRSRYVRHQVLTTQARARAVLGVDHSVLCMRKKKKKRGWGWEVLGCDAD
jgi:hypothetical protein